MVGSVSIMMHPCARMNITPDGLRFGTLLRDHPLRRAEETTQKGIVDPGANMAD